MLWRIVGCNWSWWYGVVENCWLDGGLVMVLWLSGCWWAIGTRLVDVWEHGGGICGEEGHS